MRPPKIPTINKYLFRFFTSKLFNLVLSPYIRLPLFLKLTRQNYSHNNTMEFKKYTSA